MAGAGEAYFQLGNDDREAVRYLESAIREDAQQKRRPGQETRFRAREEEAQVAQDLAIAQATLGARSDAVQDSIRWRNVRGARFDRMTLL